MVTVVILLNIVVTVDSVVFMVKIVNVDIIVVVTADPPGIMVVWLLKILMRLL